MKPRQAKQFLVALLVTLGTLVHTLIGAAPQAVADSTSTDHVTKDHPVIIVHGWTGEPLKDTKTLLETKFNSGGWQFFAFDYSKFNTSWAADAHIWQHLVEYITDISEKQKAAGGDGQVYLVTHSMGGLATRFASVRTGMASRIGGVVTVGTPHQGSPWGNAAEGTWARFVEYKAGKFTDPGWGSLARVCLAPHKGGQELPAGCASPPYFPSGIPVEQIAGNVVVERRYFGLHAYDVNVGGDGVVPTSSANGYIGSAAGPKPRGSFSPTQVDCRIPENALVSAGTSPIAVPWQYFTDINLLDQLTDARVGPAVAVLVVRIQLAGDTCSHMTMMTNAEMVSKIAESLSSLAARQAPMSLSRLKSIRVPSLCDHAAGKLKNGSLDLNEREGYVQLDTDLSLIGEIVPGRPDGAAAVFHCSQGGIGWPDRVVFYDNLGGILGTFDTGTVGVMAGRQQVSRVTLDHSTVTVGVQAVPLKGDNELWGSSRATVTYGWNSDTRAMNRARIAIEYPDPKARQLAEALNNRDLGAARRLSPSSTVDQLTPPSGASVKFSHCVGPSSGEYTPEFNGMQRGCLIKYFYRNGNYSDYMAVMELKARGWTITAYRNVGG